MTPVKRTSGRAGRPWWAHLAKWIGIAGVVGVAAGGVLVAHNERERRAYTPDEVRERLRERAAKVDQASA